jgi:RNA polymerase sigma-70 factor (ECF subfamily)
MSAGAVGVSVHRLRQRYRECVRIEIAGTVADTAQVDAEMEELFAALRG